MGNVSSSQPLVLTRAQVRAFDTWAIHEVGIPGAVLMENAGRGCAEAILAIPEVAHQRACVGVICGTGNNGGDGFVIARHLHNAGISVRPILWGSPDTPRGDARIHLTALANLGIDVMALPPGLKGRLLALTNHLQGCTHIIDALLGTGLQGELRDPYPDVIKIINATSLPVVAVDIPSGLDCDTGCPLGPTVQAVLTVTFVALKLGFLQKTAQKYTGTIQVASIGVSPELHRVAF